MHNSFYERYDGERATERERCYLVGVARKRGRWWIDRRWVDVWGRACRGGGYARFIRCYKHTYLTYTAAHTIPRTCPTVIQTQATRRTRSSRWRSP